MASYLRLEVLRTLRDPKYIILAYSAHWLLSPLLDLFGGQSTGSAGMTVQAAPMFSMGLVWRDVGRDVGHRAAHRPGPHGRLGAPDARRPFAPPRRWSRG